MRVLVVDDSAVMRRAIAMMIASDPDLQVVDSARDGQEALDKIKALRPDVVTLDIEMPVMDGLTALRRIRRECPEPRPAVLMCSTLTKDGSHQALRALCAGAADFITKDPAQFGAGVKALREELISKIKAVGAARGRAGAGPRSAGALAPPVSIAPPGEDVVFRPSAFDVVLVGSSTGGPPVLEQLLSRQPASLSAPIVIAQHMPPIFTKSMSERLDAHSPLSVVHGEDGMPLYPGVAYVIPGGKHGRVSGRTGGRLRLEVSDLPADALYKPSVNELFSSGAPAAAARCLAVVLTGMGEDGRTGAERIRARGGTVLAQHAEACVVYGMPRAVIERGIATALTPAQIARAIASLAPPAFGAAPAA